MATTQRLDARGEHLGLTDTDAQLIVESRTALGHYESAEDLVAMSQLSPRTFDTIKGLVIALEPSGVDLGGRRVGASPRGTRFYRPRRELSCASPSPRAQAP